MSLAQSIHHVAILVADVDKAAEFYRSVFEFPALERLTARVSANRGAWFRVGELELHLLEYAEPVPKTKQHFALVTDRFEEVCERVWKSGGRVEEGKLIEGFRKRGFVYDVDGNRIELLSR